MSTQEREKKGKESRKSARRSIDLKVEYKRMNAFFADYTRNISHGGTFIETQRPLAVDTEFAFQFVIPSLEEPLQIKGVVQWVVEPDNKGEKKPGMGIRFVYEQEEERRTVKELVEGLMVDSLGRLVTTKLMAQASLGKSQEEGEES